MNAVLPRALRPAADHRGTALVDATTHDVLRLERRIAGPTDVRVPVPLQRKVLVSRRG